MITKRAMHHHVHRGWAWTCSRVAAGVFKLADRLEQASYRRFQRFYQRALVTGDPHDAQGAVDEAHKILPQLHPLAQMTVNKCVRQLERMIHDPRAQHPALPHEPA